MINMDEVHFVVAKKKSQFKIKTQVDPFISNIRVAGQEENKRLNEVQFNLNFNWSYDPLWIISILRVETKSTLYFHTPRPKIERYKN